MARLRGALPVLVTIAVAAGLSYVLIGPPWPEDDASRSPGVLPERSAGTAAPAERAAPAPIQQEQTGPGISALGSNEAAIRSRIGAPPAVGISEKREVAARADRPETETPPVPARVRTEGSTVAPTAGKTRGESEKAAGGSAAGDGGTRFAHSADETAEQATGSRSLAPPSAEPPGAELRDRVETAAEPPGAIGGPADEVPGGDSPASTSEADATAEAITPAPADVDTEVADEAGGGPAPDRSPEVPGQTGESAASRDVELADGGPGELEEPSDRPWSDFGITTLRRSFARLFGFDESDTEAAEPGAVANRGTARESRSPSDAPVPPGERWPDEEIRSKSEETIKQAVRAMSAGSDPGPEPAAGPADEDPGRPTFDIVRVERDGSAVIAGRAPPGAEVEVLAGDKVIDRVTADRRGAWVSVPADKLEAGDQTLSLAALKGDGDMVRSEDVVVVAVRAAGPAAPVRDAEAPPPQPAASVAGEAPPPQPAEVVPALAPAGEPLAVLLPRDGRGRGRILQAPGRISSDGQLALMVVEYGLDGRVRVTGEAPPGAPVRIYVNNELAAEAMADRDGSWSAVLEDRLGSGTHTLRLDQLDSSGRPIARLETPFTRVDRPPREGDVAVDYVIVQPGNSLWRIARRLAGQGAAYVHIYEANRSQIRNPDLIYPGQVFEVPRGFSQAG